MIRKGSMASLIALIAVLLSAGQSLAAATSGGIILKEAVGARAQSMGEAFVGIADDATTLYWNPGGLSQLGGINLNATYAMGLVDSAYQQVMFSHHLENLGAVALGVNLFQAGTIELDLAGGGYTEVQSQSDLVINAGYGMKVSEHLGLGLGVKLINSTLVEEYNASAFAVDLGVLLNINPELTVGVSLQNIGTSLTYIEEADPLPLTARIGAGYRLDLGEKHAATLGVDIVKVNDRDGAVHMGGEYWYDNLVALRLGYKAGYALESLTAGLGVRFDMFQLDYSFSLVQELNATHKISLSLIMGDTQEGKSGTAYKSQEKMHDSNKVILPQTQQKKKRKKRR